mmetsp:Transcript_7210/g.21929  ORF Transcript_7210/g.21929 Transcript_7210/m.21929 type:complete len:208 (-) Transcript_7210:337-960(-)
MPEQITLPHSSTMLGRAPPPLPPAVGDAAHLFFNGVSSMEKGDWPAAQSAFARSMDILKGGPPSESASQRAAFCAQYYAAVRLLAATCQPACDATRSARLYRHAAGLKLEGRHAMMLMRESAKRNRAVGNNRYVADLLMDMLTQVLSSGVPGADALAASLQADMTAADEAAATGAPGVTGEDVSTWASLVASGRSAADVDNTLASVL